MLRKLIRRGASPPEAARAGLRRHAAITRPAPESANPIVYLIVAALIAFLALALLGRGLATLRDRKVRASAGRGWTWISPAITGTVVLLFVPFIVGLALALFAHRQGDWTFVGMANFSDILGAKTFSPTEPLSFYFAFVVTVLWTGINLVFHVVLGLAFALLLARKGLRLRPIYRVMLIIPWAVPNYITALIWKAMFNTQRGVINQILEVFGVDSVAWFSSFPTAFFANLCANAWLVFPFMMVCLGALQSIPADLYEAADVDGASGWQKFRHITLPLLKPALVPAILIGTVWTFNQFNIVYLVSGGEPDNATDILISEAYRWAFTRQEQYGYAAAYAALIFVILLGWSLFAARLGRKIEAAT
jgi:arabinogalactan oligomer/maltooligosaccharide transport system permease protein